MGLPQISFFEGLLAIVAIVLSLPIIATVFFRSRRPKGSPPGPPTSLIPFLGNFLDFKEKDKRVPFRKYRLEYGGIYSLCLGSKLVVIVSGYDAIKKAFVDMGEIFTNRPHLYLLEQVTGGKGIGGASGDLWKEHRQFGLSIFQALPTKLTHFLDGIIQQEVTQLHFELYQKKSDPTDVNDLVDTNVFNFISSICFGSIFQRSDIRFREMKKLMDTTIQPLMSSPVNMLPVLRLIPGDPFKSQKLVDDSRKILTYLRGFVEDIRSAGIRKEEFDASYVAMFLKKKLELESEWVGQKSTFTDDQLTITLWDLYIGGLASTRKSLLWVIAYLAQYPEWQERIHLEVVKVCGRDDIPSVGESSQLVTTEAFIMETLRHATITLTGLPKTAIQDTEIRGYKIPKGTVMLPDIDSVFIDPKIWPQAEDFNPGRFITSEGRLVTPEQFIPFSIGARRCLGEAAVKVYLVIFVASVVQKFGIRMPMSEYFSLTSLDGTFDFAHGPKPYKIVPVCRT